MSALEEIVRAMIRDDGPMPVERYMSLALGHPTLGYYMSRDPFGATGDFITAPEVSQMFGELLGVWCADYWGRMGAPARINLVELGPGRGTLMRDALRAARAIPSFFAALDVTLVETSPTLRETQRAGLADCGAPVSWRETFEDVPPGPVLVLANEFFDALPVRHFIKARDGWRERVVGIGPAGDLAFGAGPEIERSLRLDAPEGSIIEIGAIARRVMRAIAGRIAAEGGAALIVDYGYLDTGLGETLQAVREHAYIDPLKDAGEADLTTHVDFSALARAAKAAGARASAPTTQAAFLDSMGIFDRARALARNATPAQIEAIESEFTRLTSLNETETVAAGKVSGMGGLFKALAVTQIDGPIPAGFEDETGGP
jgi:NADH dehydrogenase [ubiquinone] 1 alpha subcomplex assembly factor 7